MKGNKARGGEQVHSGVMEEGVHSKGTEMSLMLKRKWTLGGNGAWSCERRGQIGDIWGRGDPQGWGGRGDHAGREAERDARVRRTPQLGGNIAAPPSPSRGPSAFQSPRDPTPPLCPASPSPRGRPAAAQPSPQPPFLLHASPNSVRRK